MRMKFLASVAVAAASLLTASSAAAAIVTIDFAGVLNVNYYGAQLGPVSGTAIYDTASADPTTEYQDFAITAFTLTSPILTSLIGQSTVTQATYAGSAALVHYVPNDAGAGYGQFELTFQINHQPMPQFNFNLVFADGMLPGGYGLPTSLPAFTLADYAGVRLDDTYGDITFGKITKFDMTAVESPTSAAPEPATWALALLGFAGAGSALRRRRALAA